MFNQITLSKLPANIRYLLVLFLLTLLLGVGLGLAYVFTTTHFSTEGILNNYGGEEMIKSQSDELEPSGQQYYAKTTNELLMTTHNHVLSLSMIFLWVSLLVYFTQSLPPLMKKIIMLEPFLSIWMTFLGMWGVRFITPNFKYLIFFSSLLLYSIFFIAIFILLYELLLSTKKIKENTSS